MTKLTRNQGVEGAVAHRHDMDGVHIGRCSKKIPGASSTSP